MKRETLLQAPVLAEAVLVHYLLSSVAISCYKALRDLWSNKCTPRLLILWYAVKFIRRGFCISAAFGSSGLCLLKVEKTHSLAHSLDAPKTSNDGSTTMVLVGSPYLH